MKKPKFPTKKQIHNDAKKAVDDLTSHIYRIICEYAEKLANKDNSSEIQPGHIERAYREWLQQAEQISVFRNTVKTLLQVLGSVLFGIGATSIALNLNQSMADGIGFIFSAVLGISITFFGVMLPPK